MIKLLLSNPLILTCIVLTTLLGGSTYLLSSERKLNTELQQSNIVLKQANTSLANTIAELDKELKERPKEYIEVTKEVYTELCLGEILGESILKLPKPQAKSKEEIGVKDEKQEYVDVDSKLPPDLVRLLQ